MSFGGPSIPAPVVPPPPPAPPSMATSSVQGAGSAATRAAAAAAGGMGFDNTLMTGPSGAVAPPVAQKTLLGS